MNRWDIPDWLEEEVRERDKVCVYCGIQMVDRMPPDGSRKAVATWEHIINDVSIVTRENIARCCVACIQVKGQRSSLIGCGRVTVGSTESTKTLSRKL